MNTPYFLIDESTLNENIEAFRRALKIFWPNSQIGYSVKTNSLPWILSFMNQKGVLAEVVSEEEYELALRSGYSADKIIYNGPIKSAKSFYYAVENGSVVNIDSSNELKFLCDGEKIALPTSIGIRVNCDLSLDCPEDFGYQDDGFRFGFSYENGKLEKAIERIKEKSPGIQIGLHLHCNSITRSPKVYAAIARYATEIIKELDLNVSYLDLGGGFFGGVPGKPTPEQYIQIISETIGDCVDRNKTKLLVEPGSALIGSAVDLVTSVLDVKDTKKSRIVTTDGSRVLIDPLWKKNRYFYSLRTNGEMFKGKQIICGYTCMDHDRIMDIENDAELKIGDKIIYHKVGAYTVTFGGPFIRYFPDVYVNSDREIQKVRNRMSVEDYIRLQS